jgi:hypothetical protein
MTQSPTARDYELAELAKSRKEQTGGPPTKEELAAIDRIIVEQARTRIADHPPRSRGA